MVSGYKEGQQNHKKLKLLFFACLKNPAEFKVDVSEGMYNSLDSVYKLFHLFSYFKIKKLSNLVNSLLSLNCILARDNGRAGATLCIPWHLQSRS